MKELNSDLEHYKQKSRETDDQAQRARVNAVQATSNARRASESLSACQKEIKHLNLALSAARNALSNQMKETKRAASETKGLADRLKTAEPRVEEARVLREQLKLASRALETSERDRLALRRKYMGLGVKMEGLLKSEDAVHQQVRDEYDEERKRLRTQLLSEKRARKQEHKSYKRMLKGIEGENLRLCKELKTAKKEKAEAEAAIKEVGWVTEKINYKIQAYNILCVFIQVKRETDLIRDLESKIAKHQQTVIEAQNETQVLRSQFVAEQAAAGRKAQKKVNMP